MKLNYTVGDSNWTQKNYIGRRFSDSVLEKPILTEGNSTNTDNNSSLLNYGKQCLNIHYVREYITCKKKLQVKLTKLEILVF